MQLRTRHISAIALPKTNEPDHIAWLVSRIEAICPPEKHARGASPLRIIGMIESAEAMMRIHDIAASGAGYLDGLLFAAEDCESRGNVRLAKRY
jgi:citrate lyase subunit beta-like protein